MADPKFVNGMRVSRGAKAPSYIIANLGIKVDDFVKWLRENQGGEWLNIDIKLSKGGKYYAELNTYNPADKHHKKDEVEENQSQLNNLDTEEMSTIEAGDEDINPDDIPF